MYFWPSWTWAVDWSRVPRLVGGRLVHREDRAGLVPGQRVVAQDHVRGHHLGDARDRDRGLRAVHAERAEALDLGDGLALRGPGHRLRQRRAAEGVRRGRGQRQRRRRQRADRLHDHEHDRQQDDQRGPDLEPARDRTDQGLAGRRRVRQLRQQLQRGGLGRQRHGHRPRPVRPELLLTLAGGRHSPRTGRTPRRGCPAASPAPGGPQAPTTPRPSPLRPLPHQIRNQRPHSRRPVGGAGLRGGLHGGTGLGSRLGRRRTGLGSRLRGNSGLRRRHVLNGRPGGPGVLNGGLRRTGVLSRRLRRTGVLGSRSRTTRRPSVTHTARRVLRFSLPGARLRAAILSGFPRLRRYGTPTEDGGIGVNALTSGTLSIGSTRPDPSASAASPEPASSAPAERASSSASAGPASAAPGAPASSEAAVPAASAVRAASAASAAPAYSSRSRTLRRPRQPQRRRIVGRRSAPSAVGARPRPRAAGALALAARAAAAAPPSAASPEGGRSRLGSGFWGGAVG